MCFFFLGCFWSQDGSGKDGGLSAKETFVSMLFAAIWPVTLVILAYKKKGGKR
jgi:hypothetical protein